ncbi:MAG: hypothetical protein ACTSXA_10180 [Candidatus Heimdallarchaeota archaeon]
MSKYTIKTYNEEFLEAQEEVGKIATKDWNGFGQSSAERLKALYSQEGFDPETKFYAFEGDKLVGFLTSVIVPESKDGVKTARLEFPITLAEHNDSAELLFNKAVETLQKKGIKKLQTRVGEVYKGTVEKAEKWGYNYSQDLYKLMEAKVSDFTIKESDVEVQEFDAERDLEPMIQIFVEKLGQTEEYSRGNFERVIKDKENFPIHLIIRENEQIVGRVVAYRNPNNQKEFNFGSMYITDDKFSEPLISKAISMMKSLGVEKTGLFLFGPTLSKEDLYSSFGFSRVGKIDFYEKEI